MITKPLHWKFDFSLTWRPVAEIPFNLVLYLFNFLLNFICVSEPVVLVDHDFALCFV